MGHVLALSGIKIYKPHDMTESELAKEGHFLRPTTFIFKSGRKKSGMLSIFFPDAQDEFYLVPDKQVAVFTEHMIDQSFDEMRKLCEKVNLDEIIYAHPLT